MLALAGNIEFLHSVDPHLFDDMSGSSPSERLGFLLQTELRWIVRRLLTIGFDPNAQDQVDNNSTHGAHNILLLSLEEHPCISLRLPDNLIP
jgi:hypothetical protein